MYEVITNTPGYLPENGPILCADSDELALMLDGEITLGVLDGYTYSEYVNPLDVGERLDNGDFTDYAKGIIVGTFLPNKDTPSMLPIVLIARISEYDTEVD